MYHNNTLYVVITISHSITYELILVYYLNYDFMNIATSYIIFTCLLTIPTVRFRKIIFKCII